MRWPSVYAALISAVLLTSVALADSEPVAVATASEPSCFARLGQCLSAIPRPKLPPARWLLRETTMRMARGATEAQAKTFGLHLPPKFDPARSLVVLVHGFDSGPERWNDLSELLAGDGFQVARFGYPNDQAISDSSQLLAAEHQHFRAAFPNTSLHIIAHSMGSLVVRDYIESQRYAGGVERLILLAPPNHGSRNVRWSIASEAVEHYKLWRSNREWSWTWAVTDGLGEAKRDLAPDSDFLGALNARPRRQGVGYTIIAGNHHCACRYSATAARWAAGELPDCWGLCYARGVLNSTACRLNCRTSDGDGAVTLASATLPGVTDIQVLPADHTTLYCSREGCPPRAWPVIRDRLVTAHVPLYPVN